MTDVWLAVQSPSGIRVWHLGDMSDLAALEDRVVRARIVCGHQAVEAGPGQVSLHEGTPHDAFFAQAQMADMRELASVGSAAVQAFQDGLAVHRSEQRKHTARAALAHLSPQERQSLIAEF